MPQPEFFPLAPSLWAATAAPAPDTAPLDSDALADVVIVGAGYCGLSTALHLAERGVRVVVLEAREVGFGGSGRNGGQVIPGFKHDPSEMIAMFGAEKGQRRASPPSCSIAQRPHACSAPTSTSAAGSIRAAAACSRSATRAGWRVPRSPPGW
jgi:glycine/D-amino acid oxidase-like deaminating enzyme